MAAVFTNTMTAVNKKHLAALLRSADSCNVGEGEQVEEFIQISIFE
jgi:hypothetical protein